MTLSLSLCRGFVESFSSTHVCRFCVGERSQFQVSEVTKLSTVDLTILREDIKTALTTKFPDATMSQAQLRIILQEHDIRKLDLPNGIPETVEELESVVRETFKLDGNFTLHYKDTDFGDEFFSLSSTSDIKDKDTIKVFHIVEPSTFSMTFTNMEYPVQNAPEVPISDTDAASVNSTESSCPTSTCSIASQDTVILSSPEHQRSERWPTEFPIPRFAYDAELVLVAGNEAFKKDGTPLNFTTILPDILDKLAESMFQYVAYPTNVQRADVAEALIRKHPCLKEPGSFNGCYGWQQRLKYKMGNYRSKLKKLGCPELEVNTLSQRSEQMSRHRQRT
ncbi:uncharacterized protein LOC132882569 [Neoarius graeffei]|uniref:uncharacterized protein LOC132882569 n=1 Tax=Neoarius graeffei TaxID=443677 RepID=UPI00298D2EE0|nr:uncharacterized protein LOC132882569 [Neoarius graeffei]